MVGDDITKGVENLLQVSHSKKKLSLSKSSLSDVTFKDNGIQLPI